MLMLFEEQLHIKQKGISLSILTIHPLKKRLGKPVVSILTPL